MGARLRPRLLVPAAALLLAALPGTATAQAEGASIAGVVTTADGRPLEGLCVEAFPQHEDAHHSRRRVTATTDAAGSYTLAPREPERYVVGFNTCDATAAYPGQWYDGVRDVVEATPVPVEAGTVAEGIDAVLPLPGRLVGTVVDDTTGDGLGGICVSTTPADVWGSDGGRTTSADDGTYAFDRLAAGDHLVTFIDCSPPHLHLSESYGDAGSGPTGGPPTWVTVRSGQTTAGVDAGLEEGGEIRGAVIAVHHGRPQPGVCVGLYQAPSDEDDGWLDLIVSGGYGSTGPGDLRFGPLRPGDHTLTLNDERCHEDGYATSWHDGQPTHHPAPVVRVRKGESTTVAAVAAPSPSTEYACRNSPATVRFPDVGPENPHLGAIACLSRRHPVLLGHPDGRYDPAGTVRRDHLASFLARSLAASGLALPANPPDAYADDDGSTHELAIDQLAQLGVVRGTGPDTYSPGQQVSRAQLASLLVRAYERRTGLALRAAGDRFSDDEGTLHESSIDKASTAGLAAGNARGDFAPGGPVHRDQAASFLARGLDRILRDLEVADPP